jgi:hypothetical protein
LKEATDGEETSTRLAMIGTSGIAGKAATLGAVSTWPDASIVAAQEWSGWPALGWTTLCSVADVAIARTDKNKPSSTTLFSCLPFHRFNPTGSMKLK